MARDPVDRVLEITWDKWKDKSVILDPIFRRPNAQNQESKDFYRPNDDPGDFTPTMGEGS